MQATREGNARAKKQKRLREGRFQGRLDGEYSANRIIEENVCADGETEYLVVWTGYEHSTQHTWESRKNMEDTEALDTWLQNQVPVEK